MKYVIIGNSAAAVGAVEGIRQADKTGKIVMVSSEKYHTYSRPLISYLIYGKTTEEKMKYRGESFYRDNGCELVFGEVTAIDAKAKAVSLSDGTKIAYDKLLVGTGSRPFVPPIEGVNSVKNQFTFMSLDDAKALWKKLTPETDVMIVGAGLIGLKAAEGISGKVKSVTVVDIADRVLPSILDVDGASLVKKHIEEHNIKFILSDSVKKLEDGKAFLGSGKEVSFDILIIASGVRPNTELVKAAGGAVVRGITTDSKCKTTLPDVYAAGDCTESLDVTTGENKILALLPNAYMQGECAGINMAGGEKEYVNAIPMNAIGFFGLHMITAGNLSGEAMVSNRGGYRKFVVKDGLLKGYILIGDVARAGIYTSLIREKTSLDSVDFDTLLEKPQLLAFSKKVRKQKLGGVKQ